MGILDSARSSSIDVIMPQFEFYYSTSLAQALSGMGMSYAFDMESADFDRMRTAPLPIHIGDVLHNTFISVDEKGTSAAAATTVMMFGCSAAPPSKLS